MQALRATSLPTRAKSKDFAAPLQSGGALAFSIELNGARLPAVRARMMLSRVASKIRFSKSPVQAKLALLAVALGPASAHTCWLSPLLLHDASEGSARRFITNSSAGGWLWVPHAFQSLPASSKQLCINPLPSKLSK